MADSGERASIISAFGHFFETKMSAVVPVCTAILAVEFRIDSGESNLDSSFFSIIAMRAGVSWAQAAAVSFGAIR